MRDYAKIGPKAWQGDTFKTLRKGATEGAYKGPSEGLLVALYLMSSPHSNMIGLYSQPILYIAYETGLGEEGARKGLKACIDVGFCAYDEESEMVWVFEMAKYQIASELKASDLRCKGIQKDYDSLPNNPFLGQFFDHYSHIFHLTKRRGEEGATQAPYQAPTKPRTGAGAGTGEGTGEKSVSEPSVPPDLAIGKQSARVHQIETSDRLPCPVDAILSLYHELLPNNPRCKVINAARKKSISSRWREASKLQAFPFSGGYTERTDGLAKWREFFAICAESPFLTGRSKAVDGRPPFIADIDFLFSPSGFVKTLENKYHREVA